jgi:hypothetical protein
MYLLFGFLAAFRLYLRFRGKGDLASSLSDQTLGRVSRGQHGELRAGKQIDNRETLIFKNRTARDFWRTRLRLSGTGPDTPLTRIVDEGDQAMKVTLVCLFLLLALHASPQEPQKPAEEKPATESKSTSETEKQVSDNCSLGCQSVGTTQHEARVERLDQIFLRIGSTLQRS